MESVILPRPPGKKLFEVHELRRIPVEVSAEAKAYLLWSSHGGRLLPQALSEHFGAIPECERVEIDVVETDETKHLTITIYHQTEAPHTLHVQAPRLIAMNEYNLPAFVAHHCASELLLAYPHKSEEIWEKPHLKHVRHIP